MQYAYFLTAAVITMFASVLFEFAGLSVKERVKQSGKTYTLRENFRTMFTCKPFRQLLISGILRSPIQLLSFAAMELILYYYFDFDPVGVLFPEGGGVNVLMVVRVLILGAGVLGGMLVSSAVTPVLARRFEKKKLYNFYSLAGAIPFVLVFAVYKIAKGDLFSMPMTALTGAEVVTGSTRMKAGTAQKMILNMISTGAMIRLGKVYGNLMVDVAATNEKLRERALRIVMEVSGCNREESASALRTADGQAKTAILITVGKCTKEEAERLLQETDGQLSAALSIIKEEK